MPLNFPSSPAVNDTFPTLDPRWRWNGIVWAPISSTVAAATGGDAVNFNATDRDTLRGYLLQYVPTRGFIVL